MQALEELADLVLEVSLDMSNVSIIQQVECIISRVVVSVPKGLCGVVAGSLLSARACCLVLRMVGSAQARSVIHSIHGIKTEV